MYLVVFGLTVSSSWGNGHAALWRGLISGLVAEGHRIAFFERDVPYYAEHRDLHALSPGAELILYSDWNDIRSRALQELRHADVGMTTSYCPDALAAAGLLQESGVGISCFYDLDTPVTLALLEAGRPVDYLGPNGLTDFDLFLSFAGGPALARAGAMLGARRVAPIYGSVDPAIHSPAPPPAGPRALLSYLGTYAADRTAKLNALFLGPAQARPRDAFVIGGAQYPHSFAWRPNIYFRSHVSPPEHARFYASSRMTLNVTRAAMAETGWCPSGRLFEAAASGAPVLSDWFEGLDAFFTPGEEIVVAQDTRQALQALDLSDAELAAMARRARERALACYTARQRAREMISAFEGVGHLEEV